jgi:hypothetical protein
VFQKLSGTIPLSQRDVYPVLQPLCTTKQKKADEMTSMQGDVHDVDDPYIGCLFGSESRLQLTSRSDRPLLMLSPRPGIQLCRLNLERLPSGWRVHQVSKALDGAVPQDVLRVFVGQLHSVGSD